jgi:hypothetical protein
MEALMRKALIVVALLGVASPALAGDDIHSFGYARLGYGTVFGEDAHAAPAIGFGYRGELESFALDISFFNYVIGTQTYSADVFAGSLLRLQAVRFLNPEADRSAYIGGGLSWGSVHVGRESTPTSYVNGWHGSGLQGEVTAGYELARTSPVRIFVQADVGLPMFYARSETMTFVRTPPGVFPTSDPEKRYVPSAVVSVGIGWQRR